MSSAQRGLDDPYSRREGKKSKRKRTYVCILRVVARVKKKRKKKRMDRSFIEMGEKKLSDFGRRREPFRALTTAIRIRERYSRRLQLEKMNDSEEKYRRYRWKNEDEKKRRETEGRVERAGEIRNESVSSVLERISFSMFRGGHRCSGPDKPKSLRSARGTLPHSGGSDISTRRP